MELKGHNAEMALAWIQLRTEAMPEPPPLNFLTWRIETPKLYKLYCQEVTLANAGILPAEQFWEVMQLAYPRVTIIGMKGNRAFAGLRLRYYQSKEEKARLQKEAVQKTAWEKKWADRQAAEEKD